MISEVEFVQVDDVERPATPAEAAQIELIRQAPGPQDS